MIKDKNILIFRFSAMGDVALAAAALKEVVHQNPNNTYWIITRPKFSIFFKNIPSVKLLAVDLEKEYLGAKGILKLYRKVASVNPDIIIDLHENLRTRILKILFSIKKTPFLVFDKGRTEKKSLVKNKSFKQLKHTTERYLDVFKRANIITETEISTDVYPILDFKKKNGLEVFENKKLIGIAPFAQHINKMWPLEKYKELSVKIQNEFPGYELIFFGGGKKEFELIESFTINNHKWHNVIGKFDLETELSLIANLSVMVCGDSSNMHFAALSGIPVVSIWGSTHHFAGFGPLFQNPENIVEINKKELECRPCSVYGNKPCARGDLACLEHISSDMVLSKLKTILF